MILWDDLNTLTNIHSLLFHRPTIITVSKTFTSLKLMNYFIFYEFNKLDKVHLPLISFLTLDKLLTFSELCCINDE